MTDLKIMVALTPWVVTRHQRGFSTLAWLLGIPVLLCRGLVVGVPVQVEHLLDQDHLDPLAPHLLVVLELHSHHSLHQF